MFHYDTKLCTNRATLYENDTKQLSNEAVRKRYQNCMKLEQQLYDNEHCMEVTLEVVRKLRNVHQSKVRRMCEETLRNGTPRYERRNERCYRYKKV